LGIESYQKNAFKHARPATNRPHATKPSWTWANRLCGSIREARNRRALMRLSPV